jgi:hypothetical protein
MLWLAVLANTAAKKHSPNCDTDPPQLDVLTAHHAARIGPLRLLFAQNGDARLASDQLGHRLNPNLRLTPVLLKVRTNPSVLNSVVPTNQLLSDRIALELHLPHPLPLITLGMTMGKLHSFPLRLCIFLFASGHQRLDGMRDRGRRTLVLGKRFGRGRREISIHPCRTSS